MGLLNVVKSYAQKDMGGVLKGAMGLFKTATGQTQKAEEYARRTRTSPADAVSTVLYSIGTFVDRVPSDIVERMQRLTNERRYS